MIIITIKGRGGTADNRKLKAARLCFDYYTWSYRIIRLQKKILWSGLRKGLIFLDPELLDDWGRTLLKRESTVIDSLVLHYWYYIQLHIIKQLIKMILLMKCTKHIRKNLFKNWKLHSYMYNWLIICDCRGVFTR